jgi:hypothetical protein
MIQKWKKNSCSHGGDVRFTMFLDMTPYCLVGGFQVCAITCRGHLPVKQRYSFNGLASQKASYLEEMERMFIVTGWLAGWLALSYCHAGPKIL